MGFKNSFSDKRYFLLWLTLFLQVAKLHNFVFIPISFHYFFPNFRHIFQEISVNIFPLQALFHT